MTKHDAEIKRLKEELSQAVARAEKAEASARRGWELADSLHLDLKQERDEAVMERDAARHELRRLMRESAKLEKEHGEVVEQRDEARAEVERLKADRKSDTVRALDEIEREVTKERLRLTQEIEQLNGVAEVLVREHMLIEGRWYEERYDLQQEIERLKKEIEKFELDDTRWGGK